jgi:hypothetical protein
MTSLRRSGNAGPEDIGFLSLMTLGRSEGATGGLPTRAGAENAGVVPTSPNGRGGGAEYGTSCIGEAQRLSSVQISEKPLRNVPATVRREAVRTPDPNWMRVRALQPRKLVPNRPLGALLPPSGSRDGSGSDVLN